MAKAIKHIIASLPELSLPAGLEQRILLALAGERRRAARLGFALHSGGAIAGLTAAFYAGVYSFRMMSESGFFSYANLVLSDASTLVSHWQTFAFLIAESVPVLGIACVVAALGLCGSLAARAMKDYASLAHTRVV